MRRALYTLKIAQKLAFAACVFAIPIAFILWALLSGQNAAIDSAEKEVLGVGYLNELIGVQTQAAKLSAAGADAAGLADQLVRIDRRWGATLNTGLMASLAAKALRKPNGWEAAHERLRALILRVSDRSDLTLDNELRTVYLSQVVLSSVPDAIDSVQAFTTDTTGPLTLRMQAEQLAQIGSLKNSLNSLDNNFFAAEASPGGGIILTTIDRDYGRLRKSLNRMVANLQAGRSQTAEAQSILSAIAMFSSQSCLLLQDLLEDRVAGLKAVRRHVLTITLLLFCSSIGFVIFSVQRGVTGPLRTIMRATQRMADGDLETPITLGSPGNELNDMQRALHQFQISLREAREIQANRIAEAEKLAHAKSEFLATMSHEIRSPMSGLLGVLELLRATELSPEQERMAGMVYNSATMLLGVLNDILDFSKIEAGAMHIETMAVDLQSLLGELVQPQMLAASRKGVAVNLTIAPDVPRALVTDSLRLRQILGNLLSNAIKFTPEGGKVDLQVSIAQTDLGNFICYAVQDTGIGMSESAVANLFNPFTQAESSTARRFGGTGLGLSISRKLALLLGGDISVRSVLRHGSVFTLRLPLILADDTEAAQAIDTPGALQAEQHAHIMVVDDDPTIRWLTQRQLEKLGYTVEAAENGEEALQLLFTSKFDLVFTDCHMPIMDGVGLTKEIRALPDPAFAGLPIIGLTADVTEEQRANCLHCGMSEMAIKPLTLEAIAQIAARHLANEAAAPLAQSTASAPELQNIVFDPQIYLSIFTPEDADGAAWLQEFFESAAPDVLALVQSAASAQAPGPARAAYAKRAHKLAGAAFSIGAMLLGTAARKLEHTALQEEGKLQTLAEQVAEQFTAAQAAVTRFLTAEAPAPS